MKKSFSFRCNTRVCDLPKMPKNAMVELWLNHGTMVNHGQPWLRVLFYYNTVNHGETIPKNHGSSMVFFHKVTDGQTEKQTDRQTDISAVAIPGSSI